MDYPMIDNTDAYIAVCEKANLPINKVPNYEKKVEKYLSLGHAKIIHKNYGNHLPKVNLKSNIYILKKL